MAKAELLMPKILQWEGGFVDDPLDAGGATNKGVTLTTFRQFYGRDATVEQLKNITDKQWLHIFRSGYWDKWKADHIANQSIADIVVDWAWCSGVKASIREVQRLLGVSDDGIVGKITLDAVNSANQQELFTDIKIERIAFVEDIIRRKPNQIKFLRGWKNRIDSFTFNA